jgi:UDP-N-acetylglucosamine--N-acetylmuramyl-(pentapeptide) pyrophosphoryl-undecaprenol N-acetylglucosamine transferase
MDLSQTLDRLRALDRPLRLIVTGGGTGGHTFPAVTTVRTVRELLTEAGVALDVRYVGSAAGLEARVAERENIPFTSIPTGKLRRASNPLRMISTANLRDAGRVPVGVASALRIVRDLKPDAVLSTGGYVSVPIGMAAELTGRPLLIHEQTVRLGLANQMLARRATRIALSAESSLTMLSARIRDRAVVTGNPIRPELFGGDAAAAVKALGWEGHAPDKPTVYVTGGAQGSVQINTLLTAVLPAVLAEANIVHQCGAQSLPSLTDVAAGLPEPLRGRYRLLDFVGPELADVLALADVVVSRSGAGTLAEVTALGRPSVLIPLIPSGGNEQEHNARHLADTGAARALVGAQATSANLWKELSGLLADPAARTRMAAAATALGRPDAGRALAAELLTLCAGPARRGGSAE